MTTEDFRGWMAYYNIEPFGERRADLRAGIVAAAVRNGLRGKGTRAFRATDFMPEFGRRAVDDEVIADRLVLWAKAFKHQIEQKRKQ